MLLNKGMKKKEIAEAIGVANSTITRELHRNSSKRGVYKWEISQKQVEKRRKRTPSNMAIRKAVGALSNIILLKSGIMETCTHIRDTDLNTATDMSEPVNPIFRIEGVFMTDLSRLMERDSEIWKWIRLLDRTINRR